MRTKPNLGLLIGFLGLMVAVGCPPGGSISSPVDVADDEEEGGCEFLPEQESVTVETTGAGGVRVTWDTEGTLIHRYTLIDPATQDDPALEPCNCLWQILDPGGLDSPVEYGQLPNGAMELSDPPAALVAGTGYEVLLSSGEPDHQECETWIGCGVGVSFEYAP